MFARCNDASCPIVSAPVAPDTSQTPRYYACRTHSRTTENGQTICLWPNVVHDRLPFWPAKFSVPSSTFCRPVTDIYGSAGFCSSPIM